MCLIGGYRPDFFKFHINWICLEMRLQRWFPGFQEDFQGFGPKLHFGFLLGDLKTLIESFRPLKVWNPPPFRLYFCANRIKLRGTLTNNSWTKFPFKTPSNPIKVQKSIQIKSVNKTTYCHVSQWNLQLNIASLHDIFRIKINV